MSIEFKQSFGFIPKKSVTFDGKVISINKHSYNVSDIECIYLRPFNFAKNEWGTVFLSLDGEDYNANDVFAKNVIKFTKKQTDDVLKMLDTMMLPVIQKENDLNTLPTKKSKDSHSILRCPHCDSINVDFVQNNKKGFSVGKAAAGAALTGGVGTLAGFAGKKGNNTWHCKACGNLFETKSN